MDRIKRLSYEVLDEHQSKFGEDFADNKKALDQISIIRSKGLKNEIAGYITKHIKKQIREEKAKQAQITAIQNETISEAESVQENIDVVDVAEKEII
ncbi:MAG: 40S ribosomal protein S17, partial [Nitrosopumilus sp.]|nr:40S ribosomal protein S17 [Nitrosopumilus sp.]